jgi:hypothetical protein
VGFSVPCVRFPQEGPPFRFNGGPSSILPERFAMLLVVTIRKEGERFAHGHISDSNSARVFCGLWIPSPVLEVGLDNPKNPYVGKAKATCKYCVSEYNNGRREGFIDSIEAVEDDGH